MPVPNTLAGWSRWAAASAWRRWVAPKRTVMPSGGCAPSRRSMQGGACKEEHVDLTEYRDFADALQQIGHFLEQVYQFKRIHSSLGYLTPSEFEAGWLN